MKIFNQTKQKRIRQKLRKNLTEPERRLWHSIRSQQLGVKVRRQHGIGPYIVDFYIPKSKLVIEIDGNSHYETEDAMQADKDKDRDSYLNSLGLRVVRYRNDQVMKEIDSVLEDIVSYLETPP